MTRIELPHRTMPQMLRDNAARMPARVALRQKDFGIWRPVTWTQYFEQASHFGLGLLALGLSPGGHVAVLSENRMEWVIAQMGCGIAGGVTVGVYPTSPAPEVAYVVQHADAELIVCEDQEQTDKILQQWEALPKLRKIIVIDPKGLRAYDQTHLVRFDELLRLGRQHEQAQRGLVAERLDAQRMDEIAMIIYTSGSTGKPKGAMISYGNVRAAAAAAIEIMQLTPRTVHLSYLPLCHIAEQTMTMVAALYLGYQVNFGESIRTVQEDLRELAPTTFLGVPRIWEKLHADIVVKVEDTGMLRRWLFNRAMAACGRFADVPAQRRAPWMRAVYFFWYWIVFRAVQNYLGLRRVKLAFSGAAPIAPEIIRFFRTINVPMIEAYGQTEASGTVSGHRIDDVRPGTVGQPVGGVEVRIADDGELLVRGPTVFAGYYKNDDATRQTVVDGWLHTGDVVEMVDGHIKIVDRIKDIIITAGGKNLSPSEIENTMRTSPYIKEVIVIGDRRPYVTALIELEFGSMAFWAEKHQIAFTTYKSLAEHPAVRALITAEVERLNDSLSRVSQVKKFHILTKELDHDDDEMTATMKIRRKNIYQRYAEQIGAMY